MDLQLGLQLSSLEVAHSVLNTHSAAEELVDHNHTHQNDDESLPYDEQDSHAMAAAGSNLAEELCVAQSVRGDNAPNLDVNIPTAAVEEAAVAADCELLPKLHQGASSSSFPFSSMKTW